MISTRLIRGCTSEVISHKPRFIALGNFDGLHRGHLQLIKALKTASESVPDSRTALISFYPHPVVALGKATRRLPLATLRQRLTILSDLGVDELIMLHFTSAFSQLSAHDFVRDILRGKFNLHTLCVGPDAAIGRGREAPVDAMSDILAEHGANLMVMPHLTASGSKIGTRAIREALTAGELVSANDALGRSLTLAGRVVRGEGRGKGISIPTANIATKQLLPQYGVYGGVVRTGSQHHHAVINIGQRPTFAGKRVSVEAHLYDYQGKDFYGQRLAVELHTRVRDERKFTSADELVSQIRRDIEQTRSYFSSGEK